MYELLEKFPSVKPLSIKIIQTLSKIMYNELIIQNSTNVFTQTKLNYILSHTSIHDFIVFDFDFADEEIVDYYINFIKILAQKVDGEYIKLYFN